MKTYSMDGKRLGSEKLALTYLNHNANISLLHIVDVLKTADLDGAAEIRLKDKKLHWVISTNK